MLRDNNQFVRVSLTKGQLILDVLHRECGSDSNQNEELFYKLNPLISSQHIPADGEYKLPMKQAVATTTSDNQPWLKVWE